MKLFLRAPFGLGVLFLLSACEIGPIGVPPVESPTSPAVEVAATTATPASEISGAVPPVETQYGAVSQYLGASDARSDGRGLTDSRTLTPAQCGRGCAPTPGKRPLDASRDKLVGDTVKNIKGGGTSVIRVTGSVDNQQKNIKAADSKKLAANRAEDTAKTIAKEIRQDLRDAGVANPNVRVVAAGSPAAATCGTGTRTCVVYQAHPQVLSDCKSPANGGCQLDLGRLSRASAVHTSGDRRPLCLVPPCDTTTTTTTTPGGGGGSSGSGSGGGGGSTTAGGSVPVNSGTSAPNPGSGIFGRFPSTSPGAPGAGSGADGSGSSASGDDGSPAFDDSYFELYPEDRFDIDTLAVRVVLDVPRTFRVGGTLTEQEIAVKEVVLYCGNTPCNTAGAPSVGSLAGRLTLGSSSAAYRLCSSERASNCEYYLTSTSTQSVGLSGSSLTGGSIDVGFRSPTGAGVRVRPTLALDELSVFVFEPVWIGGAGCEADLPAKSCWEWEAAFERDMLGSVSVVTTTGEILVKGSSGYRLERPVYGTVGSN